MFSNQEPAQQLGPQTQPNRINTQQPHPPHAQWNPGQFQPPPARFQPQSTGATTPTKSGINNPTFYSVMAAAAVAVVVAAVVIWTNLKPDSSVGTTSVVQAGAELESSDFVTSGQSPSPASSSTSGSSITPSSSAQPASAPTETASAAQSPAATLTETVVPPTVTMTAPPVTVTAQSIPVPAGGGTIYGDLGLPVAMTRPACDGMGVVFLFASVTPGQYAAEIQRALNQFPGASYLRTDQACSSLNQSRYGNPIYAVYVSAGYDQNSVCAGVYAAGGDSYGKWLNNSTDPSYIIPC